MGHFLADLRYGVRMLVKHPALAAISVLALAFGLGLTTMMWSIVYGALLRPMPLPDGDNVYALMRTNAKRNIQRAPIEVHDFDEIAREQTSFEELAFYFNGTINVSGAEGRPERYAGGTVSANLFRVLQVRPFMGRDFTDEEGTIGGPLTVILGYEPWKNRFASDPNVLGRTIRVNGTPAEIIGVMPEGFKFPVREEIWVPQRIDRTRSTRANSQWVQVVGRMKPGVTLDRAAQQLQVTEDRLAREFPKTNEGFQAMVIPFTDTVIGPEPRAMLWTMMGAVLGVLLIACSNVANLLLARAAMRTKEVAVRTALGASRWRIVSQLLGEALVLSIAGAIFGLGIAVYGVKLFNDALLPTNPPYFIRIAVDPPVLVFVSVLTFLAAVVSGVLPALQATGTKIHEVLKDESRGSSSLRLGKFAKGLVVAEIALSCGLLIGAGFMIQSVVKRSSFDYGVPTHNVFTARVGLFDTSFPTDTSRLQFWQGLEQRLAALPGQHGVSLMTNMPGLGSGTNAFKIEGQSYATDRDRPEARSVAVSPGYFNTFRVRPLEGRVFNDGDAASGLQVAVVTKNFADRFFAQGSPIGRRITFGNDSTAKWLTIVGIVPNIWYQGTDDENPEVVLTPVYQGDYRFLSMAIAADGNNPLSFTEAAKNAVAELNTDQPIYFVRTLDDAIKTNGWFYSVFGALFMAFGFAALFLATIGVYGVMSFAVSRRTQEIGVRMALGAGGRDVLRMFLRQGSIQVAVGLVIGLGLAVLLAQGLKIVLFQVDTKSPLMFALVMTVLAATGLVATLIPALRATKIDPLVALRYD